MVSRDELGHGLAPEFRQRGQALGPAGLPVAQHVDVGRQAFAFVSFGNEIGIVSEMSAWEKTDKDECFDILTDRVLDGFDQPY